MSKGRITVSETLQGHLSIAAAYIIFGLNIVICKDIANSDAVSPMTLFTLRAIGAAALFWLLSFFLPAEKVEKGDFPKIAAASLIGLFAPQLTFLVAITMSSSIDTAVMGTLGPIFTMFFAYFFQKEPITGKKASGVALSFAGVLFLIFNSVHGEGTSTPLGIVLLLANCISFSLYLGLFRPLISKYSVVTFMKWMFLFSLAAALPFSFRGLVTTDFAAIPMAARWEIGYLILFATFFAYYLIPFGQKRLRPTLVSLYYYVQPIIAAAISIWTGMDRLTWHKLLATVLIVCGVILVNNSRARNQSATASQPKS